MNKFIGVLMVVLVSLTISAFDKLPDNSASTEIVSTHPALTPDFNFMPVKTISNSREFIDKSLRSTASENFTSKMMAEWREVGDSSYTYYYRLYFWVSGVGWVDSCKCSNSPDGSNSYTCGGTCTGA